MENSILLSNNSIPTFPEYLKGMERIEDDGDEDETITQLDGVGFHKPNMFSSFLFFFFMYVYYGKQKKFI
jgi:hypothetical protein